MIEVDGPRILLDGAPKTLFGFRVGSAPLTDEWTEEIIAEMPRWSEAGINCLATWLQGSSGGFARAFTDDGKSLTDTEPLMVRVNHGPDEQRVPWGTTSGKQIIERNLRIARAARKHRMAVIVGVFYRHSLTEGSLARNQETAVRTAAAPFADLDNVIFNVWNEPNIERDHQSPEELGRLMDAVRAVAPGRPVGTGYRQNEPNHKLAAAPGAPDLFLMDVGSNLPDSLEGLQTLKRHGRPIVNVESFAASGAGYVDVKPEESGDFDPKMRVDFGRWVRVFGAWREEDYADGTGRVCAGRNSYRTLIDHVASDPEGQLHLMVHIAGWFQGASRVYTADQLGGRDEPGRWTNVFSSGAKGAEGTPQSPGIDWVLREIGL